MKLLSVNLDHVATLRQARGESFPDPVQAAVLVELGGADGITVHLRQDRRHIKERDIRLLLETSPLDLNIELAAADSMVKFAREVKPAQVTLVPESPHEVTTQGGLDLTHGASRVRRHIERLKTEGIAVCAFVEPEIRQLETAARLGCDAIEINTDTYVRRRTSIGTPASNAELRINSSQARSDVASRSRTSSAGPEETNELAKVRTAAQLAAKLGLHVHAGHGLDYRNIMPLLAISEIAGFSIGFAIIARAVFVGLAAATAEMKQLMMRGTVATEIIDSRVTGVETQKSALQP